MRIGKILFKSSVFQYLKNSEIYSLDIRLYVIIQFGLTILFLLALITDSFLNHYPEAKFIWVIGIILPIVSAEFALKERFFKAASGISIIIYTFIVFLEIHFSGSILTPSVLFSFIAIFILSVIARGALKYVCVLSVVAFVIYSAVYEMSSENITSITHEVYIDWIVYYSIIAFIVMLIVSMIVKLLKEYDETIKKANIELYHHSITDPLTEIFNRHYLDKYINNLLNDRRVHSSSVTVLMVDIDFFKQYNDHYGHFEGDNCLKIVASTLQQSLYRNNDIVFRIGGEEFLVFLNAVKKENLQDITKRIHDNLAAKKIEHKASSVSKYVTVSIGAVFFDIASHKDLDEILRIADSALYKAKETGRNRTVEIIYSERNGA